MIDGCVHPVVHPNRININAGEITGLVTNQIVAAIRKPGAYLCHVTRSRPTVRSPDIINYRLPLELEVGHRVDADHVLGPNSKIFDRGSSGQIPDIERATVPDRVIGRRCARQHTGDRIIRHPGWQHNWANGHLIARIGIRRGDRVGIRLVCGNDPRRFSNKLRRLVHVIDRQRQCRAGRCSVCVRHCEFDGARPELIGSGRNRQRAIIVRSTKDDVFVRNKICVRGGGG